MKILPITILALAASVLGSSLQAQLITATNNFTTAQGFTNGSLNGQQSYTMTGGPFTVDATAGTVFTDAAGTALHSGLLSNLVTGNVLTTSLDFRIGGTPDPGAPNSPAANSPILSVGYIPVGGAFFGGIVRTRTATSVFEILLGSTSFSPQVNLQYNITNTFRMALTYTFGANAATSTVSATLSNLTVPATSTSTATLPFDAAFYTAATTATGINARFRAEGTMPADIGSATITQHAFTAIPEPSTALLLLGGFGAVALLRRRR